MKVLFSIDVNDHPEKLVGLAMPLLKQLGATVDLVYLSEARMHIPAGTGELAKIRYAEWQEVCDREEAGLRLMMQLLPEEIQGRVLIEPGVARTELPPLTRDYDLLVMGTHGMRSGITRLMLGSVADTLVRQAHCPVTILR